MMSKKNYGRNNESEELMILTSLSNNLKLKEDKFNVITSKSGLWMLEKKHTSSA